MPEALRQARLHLFAADRAVQELWAEDTFSMPLSELRDNLRITKTWLEEYTEARMGETNVHT